MKPIGIVHVGGAHRGGTTLVAELLAQYYGIREKRVEKGAVNDPRKEAESDQSIGSHAVADPEDESDDEPLLGHCRVLETPPESIPFWESDAKKVFCKFLLSTS